MKVLARIVSVQVDQKATITAHDKNGREIRIEVPGPQVAGVGKGQYLLFEWSTFESFDDGDGKKQTLSEARARADDSFVRGFLGSS